jgi:hypothetical protein
MVWRVAVWLGMVVLGFGLPAGAYALLAREPTHGLVDLGGGVSYAVEELTPEAGSSGRMYWGKFELDRGKVDLFITPPDASLAGTRWTHRLAHTGEVARGNGLALAINGGLFGSESWPPQLRRAGQRAYTSETTVVQGTVVHWWEHTYLMEFSEDLTPTPLVSKPPPPEDSLRSLRWAIGSQGWSLFGGKWYNIESAPVGRFTAVGLDLAHRTLFLGVVEHATRYRLATELAARGATHVFMLDGSESSTFAVNGRAITGDWRPVANHIGVKVIEIPSKGAL